MLVPASPRNEENCVGYRVSAGDHEPHFPAKVYTVATELFPFGSICPGSRSMSSVRPGKKRRNLTWLVRSRTSNASFTPFGSVEWKPGALGSLGSGVGGGCIARDSGNNSLVPMWLLIIAPACGYKSRFLPLHRRHPAHVLVTFDSQLLTFSFDGKGKGIEPYVVEIFSSVAEPPPWGKP